MATSKYTGVIYHLTCFWENVVNFNEKNFNAKKTNTSVRIVRKTRVISISGWRLIFQKSIWSPLIAVDLFGFYVLRVYVYLASRYTSRTNQYLVTQPKDIHRLFTFHVCLFVFETPLSTLSALVYPHSRFISSHFSLARSLRKTCTLVLQTLFTVYEHLNFKQR